MTPKPTEIIQDLTQRLEKLETQPMTNGQTTSEHQPEQEHIQKIDCVDCQKNVLSQIEVCDDCEESKFMDSKCSGPDCAEESEDEDGE